MKRFLTGAVLTAVALACSSASAEAGTIGGPVQFTTDANSGLSPSVTYTHLLDYPNPSAGAPTPAANVNGVQFTAAGKSGANWGTVGFGGTIEYKDRNAGGVSVDSVFPNPQSAGLNKLLGDFYYSGANPTVRGTTETQLLLGLTPGQTYQARLYYRAWDNLVNRTNLITFDEGSGSPQAISINQNADQTHGDYVSYTYTAGASGALTITETVANNNGASWHNYATTNQLVPAAVPEPASMALLGLGICGLVGRVALRRKQA